MGAQGAVTIFVTSGQTVTNIGSAAETGAAMLLTKAMDFTHVDHTKFLAKVVTNIKHKAANTTLRLEIYGSDEEESDFELLDTIYFSEDDPGWTDPPGFKYYKFKFVDPTVTSRWAIHGFTIWGELGGEEF